MRGHKGSTPLSGTKGSTPVSPQTVGDLEIGSLDWVVVSGGETDAEACFWARNGEAVAGRPVHVVRADAATGVSVSTAKDRVLVVMGDVTVEPALLGLRLPADLLEEDTVIAWPARVATNGVIDRDGAIACVPTARLGEVLALGDGAVAPTLRVRWQPFAMATRHLHGTPIAAFSAGYRAARRLCLEPTPSGARVRSPDGAARAQLLAWSCVGRDETMGFWTMLGARTGWFDAIRCEGGAPGMVDGAAHPILTDTDDATLERRLADGARRLRQATGLVLAEIDAAASRLFKALHRQAPLGGPEQLAGWLRQSVGGTVARSPQSAHLGAGMALGDAEAMYLAARTALGWTGAPRPRQARVDHALGVALLREAGALGHAAADAKLAALAERGYGWGAGALATTSAWGDM